MGINLKDIFSENENELVINRSKNAIRVLIIMAMAVVFVIIIAVIAKFWGDKDKERRDNIIHDIQMVQSAVKNLANQYQDDPDNVDLLGADLKNSPQVLNVNGIEEEYRYGYYLLSPENLALLTSAVILPDEYYIVNYDTYDVINWDGIVYNKLKYHSIEDILLVSKGQEPVAKQIIRTAADLEKIRANPNGYFKLSSNLDLSDYDLGEGWKPIEQFSGTLDGRGYTISNLTIARPSAQNVGLFGEVTATANITNLKLEKVNIRGGAFVGALAGNCAGNISHVTVASGMITGQTNYVGGLVGSHDQGVISSCVVTLDSISCYGSSVGGVVGMLYSGTVTKSGAKTSIVGEENVGGVIGIATATAATYIQEVCSNSQLTGASNLGGIIGKIDIKISGVSDSSGILDFGNSYSKGSIYGNNENSGGLIGSVESVGLARISINALYTTLDIINKAVTSGGAIGYTNVSVTSSFNVNNCYWEWELAPGETLYSIGVEASELSGVRFNSKSSDEMKLSKTYEDWDFIEIWGINERTSTPYLKWEI